KIIEEPPQKTLIILITESEKNILDTIKSRCQTINFGALSDEVIACALKNNYSVEENVAKKIAHQSQGSFTKAIEILTDDSKFPFDQKFIDWVIKALRAKGNISAIQELILWSETIA